MHRDIKPANILIGVDKKAKLADFGEAKILENTIGHTHAGTRDFMAPEVLKANNGQRDASYGLEVDIYSICASFYYLIKGIAPGKLHFFKTIPTDQNKKKYKKYEPLVKEDFPVQSIVFLINFNLTVEGKQRMSASKILWSLYRIDEDDLPDIQLKAKKAVLDSNVREIESVAY